MAEAKALQFVRDSYGALLALRLVEGDACCSKDHGFGPHVATKTAHMVQGPTAYCDACAERAAEIYRVLGAHLHVEDRAVAVLKEVRVDGTQEEDRSSRAIDLD